MTRVFSAFALTLWALLWQAPPTTSVRTSAAAGSAAPDVAVASGGAEPMRVAASIAFWRARSAAGAMDRSDGMRWYVRPLIASALGGATAAAVISLVGGAAGTWLGGWLGGDEGEGG